MLTTWLEQSVSSPNDEHLVCMPHNARIRMLDRLFTVVDRQMGTKQQIGGTRTAIDGPTKVKARFQHVLSSCLGVTGSQRLCIHAKVSIPGPFPTM